MNRSNLRDNHLKKKVVHVGFSRLSACLMYWCVLCGCSASSLWVPTTCFNPFLCVHTNSGYSFVFLLLNVVFHFDFSVSRSFVGSCVCALVFSGNRLRSLGCVEVASEFEFSPHCLCLGRAMPCCRSATLDSYNVKMWGRKHFSEYCTSFSRPVSQLLAVHVHPTNDRFVPGTLVRLVRLVLSERREKTLTVTRNFKTLEFSRLYRLQFQ